MKTQHPDHHIWNNHGTFFCAFTVHGKDYTKHRVRRSLGTKDIEVARRRRDRIMHETPGTVFLGGLRHYKEAA